MLYFIIWACLALFIWAFVARASRNDNPLKLPEWENYSLP